MVDVAVTFEADVYRQNDYSFPTEPSYYTTLTGETEEKELEAKSTQEAKRVSAPIVFHEAKEIPFTWAEAALTEERAVVKPAPKRLFKFVAISSFYTGVALSVLFMSLLDWIDLHPVVGLVWTLAGADLLLTAWLMVKKEGSS